MIAVLVGLAGCSSSPSSPVTDAGTPKGTDAGRPHDSGKQHADDARDDWGVTHGGDSGADVGEGQRDASSGEDAGSGDADTDAFEVGMGGQDASGPLHGTADGGATFTVTWGGACWELQQGMYYQAMPFQLTTSKPIPLEATLFYNTTCNPADGTDNLNDTGGTVGSGGELFWFIHHPDEKSTSAIWSFGDVTSGCVSYLNAPQCN